MTYLSKLVATPRQWAKKCVSVENSSLRPALGEVSPDYYPEVGLAANGRHLAV